MRKTTRLERTACHEAGHVVVSWKEGLAIRGVSIRPDKHNKGRAIPYPWRSFKNVEWDTGTRMRMRAEKRIMVALAGYLAVYKLTGRYDWVGARGDLETVYTIVDHFVGNPKEAKLYIAWLTERTKHQVSYCWTSIKWLARALLREKELSEERARKIIIEGWKADYQKKKMKSSKETKEEGQ